MLPLTPVTLQQAVSTLQLLISQSALWCCAGEGWEMHTVGGGAREEASHDADFVLSHPAM